MKRIDDCAACISAYQRSKFIRFRSENDADLAYSIMHSRDAVIG